VLRLFRSRHLGLLGLFLRLWLLAGALYRLDLGLRLNLRTDKLLSLGDVAPAKPVPVGTLRPSNSTVHTLGVLTTARVLLLGFLNSLGLVAAGLVIVGSLSLDVAPDPIHEFLLVTTNLEVLFLTELVQNTGRTVPQVFEVLDTRRILNPVGLQHLLGLLLTRDFRNLLRKQVLEQTIEAIVHQVGKRFLGVHIQLVLDDEVINDLFEGRHFF